jgi:hypothetical protein
MLLLGRRQTETRSVGRRVGKLDLDLDRTS